MNPGEREVGRDTTWSRPRRAGMCLHVIYLRDDLGGEGLLQLLVPSDLGLALSGSCANAHPPRRGKSHPGLCPSLEPTSSRCVMPRAFTDGDEAVTHTHSYMYTHILCLFIQHAHMFIYMHTYSHSHRYVFLCVHMHAHIFNLYHNLVKHSLAPLCQRRTVDSEELAPDNSQ